MTYPIIFGGGLINFILLLFKRHKDGNTIVDYTIVLILIPSQILGVVLGNIFTKLASIFILDSLTVIFFACLGIVMIRKFIKDFKTKDDLLENEQISEPLR